MVLRLVDHYQTWGVVARFFSDRVRDLPPSNIRSLSAYFTPALLKPLVTVLIPQLIMEVVV